MTGLIYKEWRMNRKAYLICALFPPLILLLFTALVLPEAVTAEDFSSKMASLFDDLMSSGEQASPVPLLPFYTIVGSFCISGIMQTMIFLQDESKKWGYFSATHPKGVAGTVYVRYVSVFLMSVITMTSVELTQMLMNLLDHLIRGTKPDEMINFSLVTILMVFLQIFLRMGELPFFYRFGQKRGEGLKVIMIFVLMIAGFIYLMFGPLPGDDFFVALHDWWTRFKEGKAGNLFYYILTAFLWVTIIGYYVSYKISCKLYMKGVEQYDK